MARHFGSFLDSTDPFLWRYFIGANLTYFRWYIPGSKPFYEMTNHTHQFVDIVQLCRYTVSHEFYIRSQIANFMGPTWSPPGSCRPQMGPMLTPWTLLSGVVLCFVLCCYSLCLMLWFSVFSYFLSSIMFIFHLICTQLSASKMAFILQWLTG